MVHPDSELRFISNAIGYGVVATKFIPRGTITWAADDLDHVFTREQARNISAAMRPYFEKYSFVNGKGLHVMCWDHGRLMNHSCEPRSLSAGFDFEMAVRDIYVGEELTCEYGTLNLSEDFDCQCGSSRCRGTIRASDMVEYAADWDRLVRDVFPLVTVVEQPLWPLVSEREVVTKAAAGLVPIPSIVGHFARRNV